MTKRRRRFIGVFLAVLFAISALSQPVLMAQADKCWANYQAMLTEADRERRDCHAWLVQACGPNGDAWSCIGWAWGAGLLAQINSGYVSTSDWTAVGDNACDVFWAIKAESAMFQYIGCIAIPIRP